MPRCSPFPRLHPPTDQNKTDRWASRGISSSTRAFLTKLPTRLQRLSIAAIDGGRVLTDKLQNKYKPPEKRLSVEELVVGHDDEHREGDLPDCLENAFWPNSHQGGCGTCITCINGRECLLQAAIEGCGRCLCCFNNRRKCFAMWPLSTSQACL